MHTQSNNFLSLLETCEQSNLTVYDFNVLDKSSYTYVSEINSSTTWLDHFIVNKNLGSDVINRSIKYDTIISDHLPICLEVCISLDTGKPYDNDNKKKILF